MFDWVRGLLAAGAVAGGVLAVESKADAQGYGRPQVSFGVTIGTPPPPVAVVPVVPPPPPVVVVPAAPAYGYGYRPAYGYPAYAKPYPHYGHHHHHGHYPHPGHYRGW